MQKKIDKEVIQGSASYICFLQVRRRASNQSTEAAARSAASLYSSWFKGKWREIFLHT
jgi:hypothetical protein